MVPLRICNYSFVVFTCSSLSIVSDVLFLLLFICVFCCCWFFVCVYLFVFGIVVGAQLLLSSSLCLIAADYCG